MLKGETLEQRLPCQPIVKEEEQDVRGMDDLAHHTCKSIYRSELGGSSRMWLGGVFFKGRCVYRVSALTLNILRECFDPGIHFNEFNIVKNFIHLLHTLIGRRHTFPSEISCEP